MAPPSTGWLGHAIHDCQPVIHEAMSTGRWGIGICTSMTRLVQSRRASIRVTSTSIYLDREQARQRYVGLWLDSTTGQGLVPTGPG